MRRAPTSRTILDFVDLLVADGYLRGGADVWAGWRAFLAALFGLKLSKAELDFYIRCTGREKPPGKPLTEGWMVVGRRGGKSRIAAVIAVWLSICRDYRPFLAPGERGTVMVIAADRRQARVIMRYIHALLQDVPMLVGLLDRAGGARETSEAVDLTNRITIEVHTASHRTTRGYTIVAALMDEIAFWKTDEAGSSPDVEIVAAIEPSMLTIPGAMLLGLSSPWVQRGVLWDAYRDHFGQEDSDVLVWQADSRTMNPTLSEEFIARRYAKDPARAAAEYGAQFRSDLETFIDADLVARVSGGRPVEIPPRDGVVYEAFVDPSGGRGDSYTLSIAHREGEEQVVVDLVRGAYPPFDPRAVTEDYVQTARQYGCMYVTGDRYAAGWVEHAYLDLGMAYEPSERTKSQIYLEALPLFTRGTCSLPEHRTLATQLALLERRRARGGKDTVDHPPRAHDDYANAVCGAMVQVASEGQPYDIKDEDYFIGPQLAAASEFDFGDSM
jgi:hypothetical protein